MAVITPQKIQKKLLVRQGDNWFNLAERYGVSPTELAKANGDVKKLIPGQSVVIPTADSLLRKLAKGTRGTKPTPPTPGNQPQPDGVPAGIPSDVWRRMQQQPSYQNQGMMARPAPGTSIIGTSTQPAPRPQVNPKINYSQPPAGIPSDVWRRMQQDPSYQNQGTMARPPAGTSVVGTQTKTQTQTQPPAQPPAAPGAPAPKSPAAQQVLANIAAAKAKPGAFNMTDQQRVAEEWKVIFPGQPVPTFSQSFLLRLANADNAADYQRILANWSSSAGGVGAKDLIQILNKALNDPTYPWPKAIMPWEIAKYNIPEDTINQLYVYDPKLGYWVIRTNVQGAAPVAGGGGGGGGASAPENNGFTGGTGAPGRGNGGGYGNNNNQTGAGGLGLINWRF